MSPKAPESSEWFKLLGDDVKSDVFAMIFQVDSEYSASGGIRSPQAIADVTTKFSISKHQFISLVDWMRAEG